ncbi:MAG: ABC transporter ATP-binding protein [Thermoplasmata archaeon]
MNTVEINGVSKSYGQIKALSGVSINAEGNGCIALLGPNGAGKTTLMKIMTNIIRPGSGNVKINGYDVNESPEKALGEVGALIEQPEFYSYITGYETLIFTCRIKGIDKNKCEDEVKKVSEETGCSGYLNRTTREYSRGMKQRTGLASALIGNPGIIILDEPTFGLDPEGMKQMRDIILKLKKDHLVILSTHLIYEAETLADRVIIINKGTVMYDGTFDMHDMIKVTGEIKAEHIPKELISEFHFENDSVIIKKARGVRNSDIVRELTINGSKIDTFDYYNNLEELYISKIERI